MEWIFFDLGSTLVDETDCYRQRYMEIAAGAGISLEEVERRAVAFAVQGQKGDRAVAGYYGVPVPGWHTELERLYPGVESLLAALVGKGYRLGIIANQTAETMQRLHHWGIARYFSVVLASAEEGVEKPDAAIFQRALCRAGCLPKAAAMVGDRLDNDIVPAKKLGMRTVWVRQGFARYASPQRNEGSADGVISRIDELLDYIG